MNSYDPRLPFCNLKRAMKERKKPSYQPKEPEYITPFREGNEAFPVFHGITGGYPKELDTLDTNMNDDCQSIEEASKPIQKVKKI